MTSDSPRRSRVPAWWHRTPLRLRLLGALLALVAITLAATGFLAVSVLRGFLTDRVDSQLRGFVTRVADRTQGPVGPPPDTAVGVGVARLPSSFVVQVLDANGAKVSGPTSRLLDETQSLPDLPSLTSAQVVATGAAPFTVASVSSGSAWRVIALPILSSTGSPTGQSVLAAQSLSDVETTATRLSAIELVIGLVALLALVGVGNLVVRASLRPLQEVEDTAAAIADGDLSRRIPDRDPRTEVGRLTSSLNGMLHQIEAAFTERESSEADARRSEERMRRFVADASHELRTPLASIRGFAELSRRRPSDVPPDVATAVLRIEEESVRMGVLVEDLLLLARLDQQRPLANKPVDLLALASEAVHQGRVLDPNRTILLAIGDTDPPPVVLGDDLRLRQVIGNLVGNALQHTPAGTAVCMMVSTVPGVGSDPGSAVIDVVDEGLGLTPVETEHAFERFWRADASRSRDDGGSGLGLAIVESLVERHGGSVEVISSPGAGATFRVRLPLAPDPGPGLEPTIDRSVADAPAVLRGA